MRPKLLLCLALVLAGGSCQTLQSRGIVKTPLEKNGVTVEVSVPDAVSLGQPVEMTVRITNTGSQTVYYAYVDGIRELDIHLIDSRNVMPELTPYGRHFIGEAANLIYSTYAIIPLKPGEHYEWRVDLATLFEFQPGTHQVSAQLGLNEPTTPFVISTEPLRFTVQ